MYQIVQGMDRLYPHNLDKHFPHVVDTIVELWDTPELNGYFSELMVSSREYRQGFNESVVAEINNLREVRDRTRNLPRIDTSFSSWAKIEPAAKTFIERHGYECSTKGFMRSVETGNKLVLIAFLTGGAKINLRDDRTWTALTLSSFNGNEELVKLLIENGADINLKDKGGSSALHWAAYNGKTSIVELLLENNANVNAQSHRGWTSLFQAATRGHTSTCLALITAGASIDLASKDGNTPLHKACANGHIETAKLLISSKANCTSKNHEGMSPILLAFRSNHHAIVDYLKFN